MNFVRIFIYYRRSNKKSGFVIFFIMSEICEVCLASSRLTLRDLSAFYLLCPSLATGERQNGGVGANTLLCIFCWSRISQFINFSVTVRKSRLALDTKSSVIQPADLHAYVLHHLQSTHICHESNCSSDQNDTRNNKPCSKAIVVPLPLQEYEAKNGDFSVACTDDSSFLKGGMKLEQIKQEDDIKSEQSFPEDGDSDLVETSYNPIDIKQLWPDNNELDAAQFYEFASEEIMKNEDGAKILGLELVELTVEQQLLEVAKKRQSTRFKNAKYKCLKCAHTYTSQKNLLKHTTSCHCDSAGPLLCNVCYRRFASDAALERHARTEHARRWRCGGCRALVTLEQLPKHGANCAAESVHQCDVCRKKYKTKKLLKRHRFNAHESEGVTCDVCNKTLKTKDQLPNHMRIHTGEKPYECDVCGTKYASVGVLYKHKLLKHAPAPDEPPEERYCVECNKHFTSKQNFVKHLTQSRIHASQDSFRYTCDFCPKKFPLPFLREQHVKMRHSNTRDHECPHCDKAFALRQSLYNHVKNTHRKGERRRDFVCHLCGAAFMQKKTLDEHRTAVHEKLRPYKCDICHATFGFSGTLHKHMTLKHKGEKKERQSASSTSHIE